MELVSSFQRQLQVLAVRMTAPSFESFVVHVTGWIFAARRTVTGMIVAAGAQQTKHHSAFTASSPTQPGRWTGWD